MVIHVQCRELGQLKHDACILYKSLNLTLLSNIESADVVTHYHTGSYDT